MSETVPTCIRCFWQGTWADVDCPDDEACCPNCGSSNIIAALGEFEVSIVDEDEDE